jgi:hypothetical protein
MPACRPRSWVKFSPLQLYSHRNAWANSHFGPTLHLSCCSRPYIYHTSPLAALAPGLHAEGLVDQRRFALSEAAGEAAVLEYEGGPLMRLSGAGSTCQCHWDSKHNIFVQLHGRKRFHLWPTEARVLAMGRRVIQTPLRLFQ